MVDPQVGISPHLNNKAQMQVLVPHCLEHQQPEATPTTLDALLQPQLKASGLCSQRV